MKTNNQKSKADIYFCIIFLLLCLFKTEPVIASKTLKKIQQSSKVYFSLADEFGGASKQAVTEFDCGDKIFTAVELTNYPLGDYHISIKWKNPQGSVQEHTQYPFSVRKSDTRLWAWLSLSRATGAGMLQWLNPAAGLEEFIGEWQVEVRINNKRVTTDIFTVLC